MALINANGQAVLDMALCFSLIGAWHVDLRVDAPDALTGAIVVSIDDGRLVLNGTAWRTGTFAGTAYVRVVAGADGLRKLARPKHYNQTSVRIVIGDLLADAGEKLSPTASSAILSKRIDAWTTAALPIGTLITQLLASAAPGTSWRMLPNGQLWIGAETWPDSGFTEAVYQTLDENPAAAEAVLSPDAPLLLPGTTLAGRRVSRVEHGVNAGGIRSKVFYETDDRLRAALAGAIKGVLPPLDYLTTYWARVIAQSGSTVDVEVENKTIAKRFPTMSRVPLTMPAAGAKVQMGAVGRVRIGWSGGDPTRPFAFAPDADTVMDHMTLAVLTALNLGDDAAQPFPNSAFFAALQTLLIGMGTAATTATTATLDAGAAAFFTSLVTLLSNFEAQAATYLTTKAKAT